MGDGGERRVDRKREKETTAKKKNRKLENTFSNKSDTGILTINSNLTSSLPGYSLSLGCPGRCPRVL